MDPTKFEIASAATECPQGATLNIVAHEDDDLLFLSPDLLYDMQAGRCVRTVFVTAGDDNLGASYWQSRESGSKAAYAEMNGVANSWTQTDAGISGHPIPLFTLSGNPNVSLAFMRLPDGNLDGSGFSNDNNESLEKLWNGTISTIDAVDGSSSYSKQDLINTLTSLMSSFQPDQIHTQDYVGSYGDGDHSDHHTVAYFARAAHQLYATSHVFTGYEDYNTTSLPANVTGTDLTAKQNAFFTYAPYDQNVCQSVSDCAGGSYDAWLQRQYTVGSESGGGSDLALLATATASSQNASTGQTADKAIDGVVDGYPGDYTKEWATVGGGAGSWLQLTWSSPQTVNKIVLYDRPNLDDQITGGTIQCSDGSSVTVGTLPNDGLAYTITFPARTITSLQLNITAVSSTTINVGLAEIQVYNDSTSGGNTPVANAGSNQTVAINSTVQLDGSGSSDPGGQPLTYQWTQTSGPTVTLSSSTAVKPTFTAPASAATLTFQLVVNNGQTNSSPATVTITVINDLALVATATASSQNTSTGQTANKAIDGVIDGYPGDYTKEWATVGGRAGSWLQLTWSSPQTVNKIVLYDRPNLDDRIRAGNIQFSNGSSVTVGTLPNDGSAFTITFPARTITSLQLNITAVSASTINVGLAEIEVYGN